MSTLYDSDFYAWTQEQAKLLRQQKWESVDIANVTEEIESLGRQERRELRNRFGVVCQQVSYLGCPRHLPQTDSGQLQQMYDTPSRLNPVTVCRNQKL